VAAAVAQLTQVVAVVEQAEQVELESAHLLLV
jgi:hypothetical protein